MEFKKIFHKSFFSMTATAVTLALFTTGCPDNLAINEKKSGKATPEELQEKVKTAGSDINGKPIELTVDGKNITGIKTKARYLSLIQKERDSLIKVVIPDGIEKIKDNKVYLYGEEGAFGSCHNLQSVTLPDSVTMIGKGSFHHCEKLSSINITKSITEINSRAFFGCKALNLDIPATVTSIGEGAFVSVNKLQIAKDHPTLKQRDDGSVIDTSTNSLVYVKPDAKEYRVKGVARIGNYTFEDSLLEKIVMNDDVKEISVKAFSESSVKSVVLSKSLTRIGTRAFYNCKNLTGIEIPASVRIIDDFAFYQCSNLKEVKLAEGLKIINQKVFDSKHLVLEIPASVVKFAPETYNVKEIKVNPNNKHYKMGKSGEIIHTATKALVYVPKTLKGKYIVPQDVKEIAAYALNDCDEITEIYAHDGVTKIDTQYLSSQKMKAISVGPNTKMPQKNVSFLGKNDSLLIRRQAK